VTGKTGRTRLGKRGWKKTTFRAISTHVIIRPLPVRSWACRRVDRAKRCYDWIDHNRETGHDQVHSPHHPTTSLVKETVCLCLENPQQPFEGHTQFVEDIH
jgi:hypothetical protein